MRNRKLNCVKVNANPDFRIFKSIFQFGWLFGFFGSDLDGQEDFGGASEHWRSTIVPGMSARKVLGTFGGVREPPGRC